MAVGLLADLLVDAPTYGDGPDAVSETGEAGEMNELVDSSV